MEEDESLQDIGNNIGDVITNGLCCGIISGIERYYGIEIYMVKIINSSYAFSLEKWVLIRQGWYLLQHWNMN